MYKKILVPVDGSATAQAALAEAARIARATGGEVRVLHVWDSFDSMRGIQLSASVIQEVRAAALKQAEQVLADASASVDPSGFTLSSQLIESSGEPVAELIVRGAQEWGAELIVLGTHGRRGIERLVMGSDAEQVARTAPVPVMLVRYPQGR